MPPEHGTCIGGERITNFPVTRDRYRRKILMYRVPIQIRLPVEAAGDRGEGGNGTLEGLQPEIAREYTSGARGGPLPVYCQFGRKLYSESSEVTFRETVLRDCY